MKLLLPLLTVSFVIGSCAPKSRTIDEPERYIKKGAFKDSVAEIPDWFVRDLSQDGVAGTSALRANELSFMKEAFQDVIVAVIDSGVDVDHEDLQSVIWTNEKEKNGKPGIDDDKNGYIDDIHGWNFLGGFDKKKQPTHISNERWEVTREYARMLKLEAQLKRLGKKLTDEQATYKETVQKEVLTQRSEAEEIIKNLADLKAQILELCSKIPSLANKTESELTYETIKSAATKSGDESSARESVLKLMEENRLVPSAGYSGITRLNARAANYQEDLDFAFNVDFDPRAKIIGDDPNNFNQKRYGNPEVSGPRDKDGVAFEADHGTHVAGIIAADATNGIGIQGIARHAKIMALRAVPNGDEYDKDVALAVRYAVDNGAKIINMSFGKTLSPNKIKVDEAFLYAASKGVLILHAAGNESTNTDVQPSFPNRLLKATPGAQILSWMDIGASAANVGLDLVADFSNFGKTSVDVFSPGVKLLSSIPGNKYASYSGTSMATPAAAGVAALVWARFPDFSVNDIKTVLTQSAQRFDGLLVKSPEDAEKTVFFENLSRTGAIVNAYRASLLACTHAGLEVCR